MNLPTRHSEHYQILHYYRYHAINDPKRLQPLLLILSERRESAEARELEDRIFARLRFLEENKPKVEPTLNLAPQQRVVSRSALHTPSGGASSQRHVRAKQPAPARRKTLLEISLGRPEQLIATVDKIRSSHSKYQQDLGLLQLDFQLVVGRLSTKSWTDDIQRKKDRRLLPYALLAGSPSNVLRYGLSLFLNEIQVDDRLARLKDLIHCYLRPEFGTTELNRERQELAAWIVKRLSNVGETKRDWVHHFRRHSGIFGQAPASYASSLLPPKEKDWTKWHDLDLPKNSWLYQEALIEAVRRAVNLNAKDASKQLYGDLNRSVRLEQGTHFTETPIESKELQKRCIEAALLEHLAVGRIEPEEDLINFAFDALKDPRRTESNLWYGIRAEAIGLILAWLSMEDLQFRSSLESLPTTLPTQNQGQPTGNHLP